MCAYHSLHVIELQDLSGVRIYKWDQIVFSDESRYCLHTVFTQGVMVWGAISYGSRSPLVFIERSLNANRYVGNVLEPVLIPYVNDLRNFTFQQDNARPMLVHIRQQHKRVSSTCSSNFTAMTFSFSTPIAHGTCMGYNRYY
ncbi:DDE 3 domain containing protein [Asbolus verrucosus]|uniref:DDE 3 domain containing protein n=1 Tax=Asbolus verrucosus TaxID=1661398 RepID=A0A482W7J4_ASBVE|nr:DDE 3 domain containing protein [Asbolus verrucosus]